METTRPHDTADYRRNLNAAKKLRHDRNSAAFATYELGTTLWEAYIKDAQGGMMKVGEVRGTRAMQVDMRRSVRQKMDLSADRVMLFSSGRLIKAGIDKG